MRYKMGDLVELVTETNSELRYGLKDIVGVTLEKQMIPTIANLTQTDLDDFIIVHPKDFVYNPRTHGKKIGLGFNTTDRCFISTWNNNTFRVKPKMADVILPEYLYLHFLRERWDKEACFNAWGSSTVVLLWSSFCDMTINVPPIDVQRKIVNNYQVITSRITLLQKINENLEEQVLSIYDNQFGWVDILEKDVKLPDNWIVVPAGDVFDISIGKTPPREETECFTDSPNDIIWVSIADMKKANPYIIDSTEKLTEDAVTTYNVKLVPKNSLLLSFKMTVGRVALVDRPLTTNEAIAHFPCKGDELFYMYCMLRKYDYVKLGSTSSITTAINSQIIKKMSILWPDNDSLNDFNKKVSPIFNLMHNNAFEIEKLAHLQNIIILEIS